MCKMIENMNISSCFLKYIRIVGETEVNVLFWYDMIIANWAHTLIFSLAQSVNFVGEIKREYVSLAFLNWQIACKHVYSWLIMLW